MEQNTCKICKIELKSNRSKTCSSSKCKSKWKMERNRNLHPATKVCLSCESTFETVDRRNNFCSNECKVKSRHKTMVKKYGSKSITSPWETRKDKVLNTIANKSSKQIKLEKDKRLSTMLKLYNVKNAFSLRNEEDRVNTLLKLYNIKSPRLIPIIKSSGFNNYDEFCFSVLDLLKTSKLAPYSDSFKSLLKDKFNVSSEVIDDILVFTESRYLLNNIKSSQEQELKQFVESTGIVSSEILINTRPDFMNGLELDIYVPNDKLAIEFHGLSFHSERPIFNKKDLNKVKNQHLNKYKLTKSKDIKLIQIFEDEWLTSRDIIKSIISAKLGKFNNKIRASKCELKIVPISQKSDFFRETHISGDTKSMVTFGLYYNNELVSALSLRSTWNKSYGSNVIEIARFSSKLNSVVYGGFSKLLKKAIEWSKSEGYDRILTYADCRFGSGNVYLKYGFSHVGHTGPNYFYEKYGIRENRFKHRKNNDPKFIDQYGQTEREQNNNLGWYAIYDAGNEIYLLDI